MIDFEKYREPDLTINLTKAWEESTELDIRAYEIQEWMVPLDYLSRVEVNFPIKSRQVAANILAMADTLLIMHAGQKRKGWGN